MLAQSQPPCDGKLEAPDPEKAFDTTGMSAIVVARAHGWQGRWPVRCVMRWIEAMKKVGAVIFPSFEMLDLIGPLEMFGLLQEVFAVTVVAEGREPGSRSAPAATR